ncbi:hypothetical protein H2248_007290 [Termitomyces sp. 'cryptogamus']|nr:hypothetical protein H2248_007290 [Termitomyces sp. 'cryptogamus']
MFTKARNVTVNGGEFKVENIYHSDPLITQLHQASAAGALYDAQDHPPLTERPLEAPAKTIQEVLDWFSSPESKPLLHVRGPSKSTNSAIACTIVERSKERGQFAAGFFFNSRRPKCSSIKHLVPTIADQLIELIPGFYTNLTRSLHGDPFFLVRPIPTQVDQLILQPLHEITARGPFLVIIDALDDCASEEDQHEILTQISRIVLAHQDLIRFVILTSPAPHLKHLFDQLEFRSISNSLVVRQSHNGALGERNLTLGKWGMGDALFTASYIPTTPFNFPRIPIFFFFSG